MRVPRIITFSVGAAVGAAVVYLSDDVNGSLRRRTAVKDLSRLLGRAGLKAGEATVTVLSEFGSVARATFEAERNGRRDTPADR